MLKHTVNYLDFHEGKDVDVEKELRFVYTPKTIKLYEQRTGKQFFQEYNRAFNQMSQVLFASGISFSENVSEEDAIKLMPMMTDPAINEFLIEFAPCMYAKVENGVLIQNEQTIDEAEDSMWLMNIINVEFFMSVFQEISGSSFTKKKSHKKSGSKKA